ncbi:MAG: M23 family metallopeptidase [Propionibacteriaceae bacterium]
MKLFALLLTPIFSLVSTAHLPPAPGTVVREFFAPQPNWLPGHRGLDIAADVGDSITVPADGVVTFTGNIAGRPVVVITHGSLRSTYEPVVATVSVGAKVHSGQQIGTLLAGHPECTATACLHWGLRRGKTYLDPRILLKPQHVRLLPTKSSRPDALDTID